MGAYRLEGGILVPEGKLARRWMLWAGAAMGAFWVATAAAIVSLQSPLNRILLALSGLAFVSSCAASCVAFLALFLRFAKKANSLYDTLRDNAYGMYLIHYAFVTWLQYALLKSALPAIVKGSVVFAGTVLLSWGTTAVLPQIPAVKRVI